jgi:hypothetical protein
LQSVISHGSLQQRAHALEEVRQQQRADLRRFPILAPNEGGQGGRRGQVVFLGRLERG